MEPTNFFNPSQGEAAKPLEGIGLQSTNFFNFPLSPEKASNFAVEHDAIFMTLLVLSLIFSLAVAILLVVFITKYRRNKENIDRSNPINNHVKLEMTWTIIPLILSMVVFFLGADLFGRTRTPPKDAHDVYVIGKQWMWQIQHPNGVRENNELHVPLGQAVRLTMISQDVIHAMYIPAFRVQFHVVPGRYTNMWFVPTKPGKYSMLCNMHCGTDHSEMTGWVHVMEPADFQKWMASAEKTNTQVAVKPMEKRGAEIFEKKACGVCHGEVDTPRGPSLYGLFGKNRRLTGGKTVVADEAYIRESILQPYNNIVEGYATTMPTFSQISEDEVLSLISYIKSLGMPNVQASINTY